MITLMTMNAMDLYASDDAASEARYAGLEALIRARNPDIVVVQEIISEGADRAEKWPGVTAGARRLAAAVRLQCEVDGDPAVAVGGVIHHVALLWREGIRPVPRTLHRLERGLAGMWHCEVSVVFDFGGRRIRVGGTHLSPFAQAWCAADAAQLLRVFNGDDVPGLLGGDFNGFGSDPAYDPDPYHGVKWHPDHVYQFDHHGEVDRQAAIRLELGRMQDCARMLGAPWEATSGIHPASNHPPRRMIRWYATYHMPHDAIAAIRYVPLNEIRPDGPDGQWLTDHRPVEVTVNEQALDGIS